MGELWGAFSELFGEKIPPAIKSALLNYLYMDSLFQEISNA